MLKDMTTQFPIGVGEYVVKNKAEIILSHLTRESRVALGRVLADGRTAPAGHSQGCESVHAVLDRILANRKHDLCSIVDVVLELYTHQFNNHVASSQTESTI